MRTPTISPLRRRLTSWLLVAITIIAIPCANAQDGFDPNAPMAISDLESKNQEGLFSFRAVDMEIKQALALFAETNGLNIVPNHDVVGSVTVSFMDLPLELAMEALLDAHGYYFTKKDKLIRVKNFQTRVFQIDYINTIRAGSGSNDIQFSSGGGDTEEGSSMTVSADSTIDFWQTIRDQLGTMVSEEGSFTVNSLAGVVSVTERFSRMQEIASVLDRIGENIVRQVELEVEIYEVVLDDSSQLGINWSLISSSLNTTFSGSQIIPEGAVFGSASGTSFQAGFSDGTTAALLEAIEQQGKMKVLSKPKLRTLNNQPAVIRVGQDFPVFRSNVTVTPGNPPIVIDEEEVETITIGTVLSITPQISPNGMITLDVSPAISRLIGERTSSSSGSTAPIIDVRQSSSIVRVETGNTVVLGGLVQTQTSKVTKKVPIVGDIPFLGKAFKGYRETQTVNELVIVLTPRISE